jgi:hypothetical protein
VRQWPVVSTVLAAVADDGPYELHMGNAFERDTSHVHTVHCFRDHSLVLTMHITN